MTLYYQLSSNSVRILLNLVSRLLITKISKHKRSGAVDVEGREKRTSAGKTRMK